MQTFDFFIAGRAIDEKKVRTVFYPGNIDDRISIRV